MLPLVSFYARVAGCLLAALQAILLTDSAEKLDPMSLLFYMSSFSVMLLLPTTLALEPGSFAQVRGGGCGPVCTFRSVATGMAEPQADWRVDKPGPQHTAYLHCIGTSCRLCCFKACIRALVTAAGVCAADRLDCLD